MDVTCLGWSIAFWGSVLTLLLGWLVTLVTGCLKMEAVCLTGSDVLRSGLPFKMKIRVVSTQKNTGLMLHLSHYWLRITHEKTSLITLLINLWHEPVHTPLFGCCCHIEVSAGSYSVCSWAFYQCENQRNWGPLSFRGNGPAVACSETSFQLDWERVNDKPCCEVLQKG